MVNLEVNRLNVLFATRLFPQIQFSSIFIIRRKNNFKVHVTNNLLTNFQKNSKF
ncbi:hypothetical protein KFK09_004801 [Dendrobium nobile]|uniref:Uncharacterized protein n=1 Tax=Dendrobium nobile TaxID=94219 RepID=A0A8T3BWE4_DENNO|nr:hypothetical protein KFK09_004801 [Dendrobium nobile]